eukprot:4255042-Alexandrium_andersonii.AAC.1
MCAVMWGVPRTTCDTMSHNKQTMAEALVSIQDKGQHNQCLNHVYVVFPCVWLLMDHVSR